MINSSRFFSVGFALVLVLSVLAWFMYSPERVLEKYQLKSTLKQLNKEQINQVLNAYVGESFWRLNIEQIHADLVKLDWIYQAEVARKWPNTLQVKVIEQIPVAKWGENALLNQNGDVFYPHNIEKFAEYAVLYGEDAEAKKMLQKLAIFQQKFNELDWVIRQVDKRVDKGWMIYFVSNQNMIVGREDWQHQLDRFIKAYPKVKKEVRNNAQTYDLRYSNGFVIKRKNNLKGYKG